MKKMYFIQYFLFNDTLGCLSWYRDKETVFRAFSQMRSNYNYQRALLFDTTGALLDSFSKI